MEAPTRDPTAGKAAEALLEDGPGAGAVAGPSEAKAALMEAAATRMAHVIFFISMVNASVF